MEITMTKSGETPQGTYEKTFVVSVPVERAWQVFTDPAEREKWMVPPGRDPSVDPDKAIVEGTVPDQIKIGDVEPQKRLNWQQGFSIEGQVGWVDTTVVFEETESGTKITVTRSGFGDSETWRLLRESTTLGWDHAIADLTAYLEHGVPGGRHFAPRGSIGATMHATQAGVCIADVVPGGFAEEAGLQRGDLLLMLGGAPVIERAQVWSLEAAFKPGQEIEVTYVRDGQAHTGKGHLSKQHYTEQRGYRGA